MNFGKLVSSVGDLLGWPSSRLKSKQKCWKTENCGKIGKCRKCQKVLEKVGKCRKYLARTRFGPFGRSGLDAWASHDLLDLQLWRLVSLGHNRQTYSKSSSLPWVSKFVKCSELVSDASEISNLYHTSETLSNLPDDLITNHHQPFG